MLGGDTEMVDTMIRLFESTATSFLSNGLGSLPDASKCEVTEERNGSYELEMEYHVSGKRYSELKLRSVLVAKPNPYADPQPFRIYEISKPINGLVTVKAEHISYDMSGYPVSPFTADSASSALEQMKDRCITDCPFEFSTDIVGSDEKTLSIKKPETMRALLGGSENSVLDIFGGEYEFDKYRVILHDKRGTNRGVTIRYGKNMTDLKQEENCSNVYTAVYPYFLFEDSETGQSILIEIPEKTVPAPGTYDFTRIYPLDVSSSWNNTYEWEDEYPSEEEIREIASKYIEDNALGTPKVSLTVSFELLSQAKEYETLSSLERVHLCDTVHVEFPKLNVSATSKCIKTTYNVLTGKYVSIELGEPSSSLTDSIVSQNKTVSNQLNIVDEKINDRPTKDFMDDAIDKATALISGGLGGYVVIHSTADTGYPDEILIMNTPDIKTATQVWRWNKGGLGYSSNGYGGPYATAITQDGMIVADFVKTGNLTANVIRGGTLTVGGLENSDGRIEVKNAAGDTILKLSRNGIQNGEPLENGEYPFSVDENGNVTIYGNLYGLNNLKLYNASRNKYRTVIELKDLDAPDSSTLTFNKPVPGSGAFLVVSEQEGTSFRSAVTFNSKATFEKNIILQSNISLQYTGDSGITARGPDYGSLKDDNKTTQGAHYVLGYYPSTCNTNVGMVAMDTTKFKETTTLLRGNVVKLSTAGSVTTSDARLKNSFKSLDEYNAVYMDIEPCAFRYNNGTSGRYHFGAKAQSVKEAFEKHGYTTQDFGGFVQMSDNPEDENYCGVDDPMGLIYTEFTMWNMHMIQKLYRIVNKQKEEIDGLRRRLDEVLTYMEERK